MPRKLLKYGGAALLLILLAIQFLQPDRTNPRSDPEASFEAVAKPSPELAAILQRSCYNCHSNTTNWPWYSRVAPVSWLVADDVEEGRSHLNFSEWKSLSPEGAQMRLENACREVTRKDMPLWVYRVVHPEARLSEKEIETICAASKP